MSTATRCADRLSAHERFFAHMSHELRTPLNTVLGYSTLLSEGAGGALPPPAAEMVGRIVHSAEYLRVLVDDLLDLGRLDAGKVQLTMEPVLLPDVLRGVLAAVEPQALAKGLTLALENADVPCLWTDATRVRQIVLNLASNAVKFTDRGGVTLSLERRGSRAVTVCVADTGVGIAPEDLGRVFDEFVQVGRAATASGGTGLGLAISRRLARLLGGELTVRSAPARGSTFMLTLPCGAASGA